MAKGNGNKWLTDEEVEAEILRLQASPLVALAKKEERIRYRRRQYMYTLRLYEKKGREMAENGVTLQSLDQMMNEMESRGKERK